MLINTWTFTGGAHGLSSLSSSLCDGATLTIYFDPNQVAPYSEGIQKVSLPLP
ncbi:MAG: DUF3298 domain-containing protein [Treponema sp.]|nr:DUF3298 domain-containing protein [Treponema sp.]